MDYVNQWGHTRKPQIFSTSYNTSSNYLLFPHPQTIFGSNFSICIKLIISRMLHGLVPHKLLYPLVPRPQTFSPFLFAYLRDLSAFSPFLLAYLTHLFQHLHSIPQESKLFFLPQLAPRSWLELLLQM